MNKKAFIHLRTAIAHRRSRLHPFHMDDMAYKLHRRTQRNHLPIHFNLKIDTGMSRLGFPAKEESIGRIEEISRMPNMVIEGMYTHFGISLSSISSHCSGKMHPITKIGLSIPPLRRTAVLGTYLHGKAGDYAQAAKGSYSVMAQDLGAACPPSSRFRSPNRYRLHPPTPRDQ